MTIHTVPTFVRSLTDSYQRPHVFEVADRIHVHRLGKRLCVIRPQNHSMSDAVAYMTGAKVPDTEFETA